MSSRAASLALTGLFSPNPAPTNAAMNTSARPEVSIAPPRATNASAAVTVAPPFAPSAPFPAVLTGKQPLPEEVAPRPAGQSTAEIQKLRNELRRLELFVKKLQAELDAEHQYCAALEAHFKALQESEDSC